MTKYKFYFCIDCGFHGAFAKERTRNVQCESCENKDLTQLNKTEYDKASKKSKTTIEERRKRWTEIVLKK